MAFYGNVERKLWSKIYCKPNQELKYVNYSSMHTATCLCIIPSGDFHHLPKLTSKDEFLRNTTVNELYPDHINALWKARFLLNEFSLKN